ncbi:MAG: hypothetical protein M1836_001283 [Candelina mexicana]|nr:MAG: hypothetical protein M1836_001283 [Candelina mexicana]
MPPVAVDVRLASGNSSVATASPGLLIEPDSQASETDSEDEASSTRSVTSSIFNHIVENGRRYHRYREGSYVFPNDEIELERLDLQNEMLKFVFGGRIHFAPLRNPKKVLDIGTGTGIWPMEMSELYPNCDITGTDLSPIQPELVPDNVHFLVDDASEEDWLYSRNTFDYIHTRMLLGAFEDFRDIIRKGFRYTKRGGYMESQELYSTLYCDDGTMPDSWPFQQWAQKIDDASMSLGRPLRIANKLKRWYEEAGFVDVQEHVFKLPVNPWPRETHYKDIGRMCELCWSDGIQGFTLAYFSRVLGWSKEEIEVYLVNVRKSLKDRRVHAYHKVYVVWGRKPDAPRSSMGPSTSRHNRK